MSCGENTALPGPNSRSVPEAAEGSHACFDGLVRVEGVVEQQRFCQGIGHGNQDKK